MNSTDNSSAKTNKIVIVMVHGTFAAGGEKGTAWWQRDSEFWSVLSSYLGDGYALPPEGSLFKWSGKNSEAERQRAGIKLHKSLSSLGSILEWWKLVRNRFKPAEKAVNGSDLQGGAAALRTLLVVAG